MLRHVQLFVTPWTLATPGIFVHGILQAIILEWVAISFSRRSSWPWDQTHISCFGKRILYCWATKETLPNILAGDIRQVS